MVQPYDSKRVSYDLSCCHGTVRFSSSWTVPDCRLTLLIDADDTLWENNIYFLEVTEMFSRTVVARGIDRGVALHALNEIERKNIPSYGYGSLAFSRTVAETFALLLPHADVGEVEHVCEMARAIYRRDQIELLPTVAETLESLAPHHQLVLVTKGDPRSSNGSWSAPDCGVILSGSRSCGRKMWPHTLRSFVACSSISRTWMIGNSPRSDINPAVRAGLSAVLIPHPHTWS